MPFSVIIPVISSLGVTSNAGLYTSPLPEQFDGLIQNYFILVPLFYRDCISVRNAHIYSRCRAKYIKGYIVVFGKHCKTICAYFVAVSPFAAILSHPTNTA